MNTRFEKSSGNVFADLGLPNSEQELLKATLTVQIYKLIREQNLTQTKAAELLGTTQAQVSALMRCRPVSVSVGRFDGVSDDSRPGRRGDRQAVADARCRAHVSRRATELTTLTLSLMASLSTFSGQSGPPQKDDTPPPAP